MESARKVSTRLNSITRDNTVDRARSAVTSPSKMGAYDSLIEAFKPVFRGYNSQQQAKAVQILKDLINTIGSAEARTKVMDKLLQESQSGRGSPMILEIRHSLLGIMQKHSDALRHIATHRNNFFNNSTIDATTNTVKQFLSAIGSESYLQMAKADLPVERELISPQVRTDPKERIRSGSKEIISTEQIRGDDRTVELEQLLKNQHQESKEMSEKIKQYERDISQQTQGSQKLEQELSVQKDIVKRVEVENKLLQNTKRKLELQVADLEDKLRSIQSVSKISQDPGHEKLAEQNAKLEVQLSNQLLELNNARATIIQNEQKLNQANTTSLKKIKSLEQQLTEKDEQIAGLQGLVEQLQGEIQKQQVDIEKYHERNQDLRNQLRTLSSAQANQIDQDIQWAEMQVKVAAAELKAAEANLKAEEAANISLNPLFAETDMLTLDQKMWIADTVKNHNGHHGDVKTKVLYKYDRLNTVNFHHYIDNQPHLLSIIKLKNGTILSGYSVEALKKGVQKERGDGLLMQINNKYLFAPSDAEDRKSVLTYDEYYYIFGNSELRLRSQELKCFSNFAVGLKPTFRIRDITSDTVINRKQFMNIDDISDNDQEIESFEFHQIIFGGHTTHDLRAAEKKVAEAEKILEYSQKDLESLKQKKNVSVGDNKH